MDFAGAPGEKHAGLTRPSCSRFTMLYPKGTTVRNTRQLSILSDEELNAIAAEMGMARLAPEYLGASLVVKGIPDFTHVPPSSRLVAPSGLVLTVDLENGPCHLPGKEIEADHPGFGAAFKPAAQDRRGVTAWVERPGALSVGEVLTLFLPTQRGWRP
jgi:MOSC domain-containing protein YiiM